MSQVQKVEVRRLSGAMTNLVLSCSSSEAQLFSRVIVRVFGSGNRLFSQEQEQKIFLLAAELGLGPKALYPPGVDHDSSIRIEEYLNGHALTCKQMRHPDISASVAVSLAEFHYNMTAALKDEKHPAKLWHRVRTWYSHAIQLDIEGVFGLQTLLNDVDSLEVALKDESCTMFCHNDLQHGNIMLLGDGSVQLIDFEYSSFNDVAFDIANHFVEWAADYNVSAEEDGNCMLDWNRLPNEEQMHSFCTVYTDHLRSLQSDWEITSHQLEKRVRAYMPLSHLKWALWAIIQHYSSDNLSFNYKAYADIRLQQFQKGTVAK